MSQNWIDWTMKKTTDCRRQSVTRALINSGKKEDDKAEVEKNSIVITRGGAAQHDRQQDFLYSRFLT